MGNGIFLRVPEGFTRTRTTHNPTLVPAGITHVIRVVPETRG